MPIRTAENYSELYLEIEKPQPLTDKKIEILIQDVLDGKIKKDITDQVYIDFQNNFKNWLSKSKLNNLKGLESFTRSDICIGCTQFIDTIYMNGPTQVLRGDYRYHERLRLAYVKDVGSLIPEIPLIIAMPFPSVGAPHQDMEEILHECKIKKIPVHIDGAWVSCCRDIDFNFDHEVIRSVGISLSKGLGLGWNRIGLRWTKDTKADAITIMNDFHMNNRVPTMIANHLLTNLDPDHLWNTHKLRYNKVCQDFNLVPTKSIHLALKDGQPVGVSPLIRYLENEST